MNNPIHLLTSRRLLFLTGLAAAIGLVGGGAAWVLVHLIELITNVMLFGHFTWDEPPPFTELTVGSRLVIVPMIGAFVVEALQLMLEEEVEHLPVVDSDRLVGICTRTDVMSARRTQIEHERRQPGWSQSALARMFARWYPDDDPRQVRSESVAR